MAADDKELTPKEERFCREYLKDLNATQAAIRTGYSKKTSYSIGQELLKKPVIAWRVKELIDARNKRLELAADRVLLDIKRIAFMDMADFATWDSAGNVTFVPKEDMHPDQSACIAEFTTTEQNGKKTIKFKLQNKMTALDKLCKHMGLYKERGPLDTILDALPPEIASQLREAIARAIIENKK